MDAKLEFPEYQLQAYAMLTTLMLKELKSRNPAAAECLLSLLSDETMPFACNAEDGKHAAVTTITHNLACIIHDILLQPLIATMIKKLINKHGEIK